MSETQTLPALVRSKYPGQYDDISDADLDTKVRAKFPGVYDDIPKPSDATPHSATSRATDIAAKNALPIGAMTAAAGEPATRAVEAFATSPTAAKVGGAIARTGTTIAGVAHGAATGNIPEIIASPIAGWQAGKGGYWLTKAAQSAAGPVASALEAAKPALGVVGDALNVGTIAEAESKVNARGTQYFNDPQVQLKMVQQLIEKGSSPADAVKKVSGGTPQIMGPLMGLYLRSRIK